MNGMAGLGRPGMSLKERLLRGSSVVALVTAIGLSPAAGQSMSQLRAAVSANNQVTNRLLKNPNIDQAAAEAAGMSAAAARALHYQQQVAQALALAQQAQIAARQAVLGSPGNVPDGLVIGGLQEVPNPLPASKDQTGLSTWQGAEQPTETHQGKTVDVNIKQTQQRAILSWETFNVGQHTILNFDQSYKGHAEPGWVVLNRVVGDSTSPAEILGQIKAQGTVLIIDTNGILFGGASQINVNSLIASTLEIGHALDPTQTGTPALSYAQRNDLFLEYGLLGFADQASSLEQSEEYTFSPYATGNQQSGYTWQSNQGPIEVDAGAIITANKGGSILLTGPKVINAGQLTAPEGQVSLEAGAFITLDRSTGAAGTATPDIRGFSLSSAPGPDPALSDGAYAENTSAGIISAPQGYVSLMSIDQGGGVINDGILEATTSVSRNGFIQLDAADIQLGAGSTIAIDPDTSGEVIPRDPVSLTDFKASKVAIGGNTSLVEMQRGAMIYAPGGNVTIGVNPGADTVSGSDEGGDGLSRVFIDSGAVIDVAGLPNIIVPASLNSIAIHPVTGNDLQDNPNAYKDSFLNGATVYVDPRLSGVRSDGVAWVGSPLIPAGSYAQQVGISVQQLMTRGGNVSLGADSYSKGGDQNLSGDVTIKSGAVIDLDGGWVTYQAGWVRTSELVDMSGNIVNIGDANPNDTYVGVYDGFTAVQARWGVVQNFADPLFLTPQYEPQYTEGRDAGSLTLKSSVIVLDGTVYAHAFPGPRQFADAQLGTFKSKVYGDGRLLQGAPSQLPSAGFLFVQALANDAQNSSVVDGGGDIAIVDQADYHALPEDLSYGQSISIQDGQLVIPARDPNSYLPTDRIDSIMLNADALSAMGLSDLALATSGEINVEKGAEVNLSPGGTFQAVADRAITVDGKISAPGGSINLQTIALYQSGQNDLGGSVFVQEDANLGSFDITVNGQLSTRGLWTNDFGALPDQVLGQAYTGGGSVTLDAAPSVLLNGEDSGQELQVNKDISGSILINQGALIDVSGGGYVSPTGALNLSARGGNVSLIDETNFFQTATPGSDLFQQSAISGFRVTGITCASSDCLPSNPDQINARVTFAPGTIIGYGFGGGGTFMLDTPSISFGDGVASSGTELPLDFFSKAGFANYDITTYKTDLIANQFDNGYGGYNAVLGTDVLTIGAGQTLDLTQSYLALDWNNPAVLATQMAALQNLASGGDIYSVIKPSIPTDAWDRKAVNLTLGGLIELQIAKGGTLRDEAGGVLTVSQLDNEGTIRIPGGIINQTEILPTIFGASGLGVHSLADVFSTNPDGTIDENAANKLGLTNANCTLAGDVCTNAEVAVYFDIYLLGTLNPGEYVLGTSARDSLGNVKQIEGIHLGAGSITDLSGVSIRNPRAVVPGQKHFITGEIVSGGTLESQSAYQFTTPLFEETIGFGIYGDTNLTVNTGFNDPTSERLPDAIVADPGSTLNISGASDRYDELQYGDTYAPARVWSNAGTLDLGNGGTITGATILAHGGAPRALGGTLVMLDPVFYQNDPSTPTPNAISQQEISASGFATMVAEGSIDSVGDATIKLSRGFFLTSRPYDGQTDPNSDNDYYAIIVSSGGNLEIDAPYIGFDSVVQSISTPDYGTAGRNSVTFRADNIDVMGAVLFDTSIANATLYTKGDVRLIGVRPAYLTLGTPPPTNPNPNTLQGQLSVNGNLTIDAAQVYPTTGSTFYVTSADSDGTDGTIRFGRTTTNAPPTPYSAGADLTIQAANIVLGGVIRVPVGSLTIGSDSALYINGSTTEFAPLTNSVEALAGSITSVSAGGLSIPYGTTTDQSEWYFAPTSLAQLTAPPKAILTFGGSSVSLDSGATVDLSGGGNLYAYEFIPGLGGSRDVLDRFNPDEFSGNAGYQYPGGAQVYAIVPSLSSNSVATYDPIYSANYGDLYAYTNAGQSIYLTGAPGLSAGWYTLLPAQYAMLPGGMRVVQQMNAGPIAPGTSETLSDGTMAISGYYGVAGTDTRSATPVTFEVQGQNTFRQYSQIALTFADAYFAQLAAKNGDVAPRLPIDAGRLILAPTESLAVNTTLVTTPGEGGRGSEVDITGNSFDIVSSLDQGTDPGAIVLTADSLTNLDASSLLIGGVRTDNADGTTSLDVTAQSITVANDSSHPLEGPEILLAVDGEGAGITLDNDATIIAKGTTGSAATGNYVIDGGDTTGAALLRVAMGPQRLASLENVDQSAGLTVDNANLEGNAILLDSSGDMTVAPNAVIEAEALALGAGQVTFTNNGSGLSGLVITRELQALFSRANVLTILTPNAIAFASGSYDFGNIVFDTPGLSLLNGNGVTINADTLTFMNGSKAMGECGQSGVPACGNGTLSVNATQINFGWGAVDMYGFGGRVSLAASRGIFMTGKGSVDFGPAALNLDTPYIGDAGYVPAPGASEFIPAVSLVTTGAVVIDDKIGGQVPDVVGAPGASLTIDGHSISVDGTELRATAGTLTLDSQTGIDITGGAVLETPSYVKTFGDSADPTTIAAPGGTLKLIAENGGITAAAGTTLSIGGSVGTAGTLSLSASNGTFNLDGTIVASTPNGGGSLDLNSGGAFDLAAFADGWGKNFTRSISIRSAQGNLELSAGETLDAQDVSLTADGGIVDIAGTIDVSGVNGGGISLYGLVGVTLENTAVLDAHADGYGKFDPRQASGGIVNIGTDDNGIVNVKSGAVIDVRALRTQARLIPITLNGAVYYYFVPADVGGQVNFRLPVIQGGGGETVNMYYAGNIEGASSIVLQGFERWNLADIANDPNFVGVTINSDGQAVLDVSAQAGTGQLNFLADDGAGTVANFIQNFDISASYGNLGNLTSMSNFHARPGVELDYSGDIVLSSNWNLGAGTVNIAAAVAAGLMLPVDPGCTSDCQYYIIPGDAGKVFAKYTTLTYRVGGQVLGEPGVLTLRASGNLEIDGSITDGFFQFGDQTDANYLAVALGAGNRYYIPYLIPGCAGADGNCNFADWQYGLNLKSIDYVDIPFPKDFKTQNFVFNPVPYNPDANTPWAEGNAEVAGNSCALSSMQPFPLVQIGDHSYYVPSWSYQLVAGADLTGAGGNPSVNPLQTVPGSSGSVTVQGVNFYTYGDYSSYTQNWANQLDFQVGTQYLSADSWYMAFLSTYPQAGEDSYTYIDFSKTPTGLQQLIGGSAQFQNFLTQYSGDYQVYGSTDSPTAISMNLFDAVQFMQDVIEPNILGILQYSTFPKINLNSNTATANYETLIRTGTGSIDIAAAQDINLQNGQSATYLKLDGEMGDSSDGLQLGGSPVYTAGHLVIPEEVTVVDELTGDTFTIDPSQYDETGDIFSQPINGGYQYGVQGGSDSAGFVDIMIANPVYLTGGGNISLTAGNNVLSRRDVWDETRIADNYNNSTFFNWIGSGDQAWRVGTIGDVTNILINPQLFTEGVGALGGGNITISAGHDIVDLTVADDTSVTTASITGSAHQPSLGIWQFGGGNVTINAGTNILGGRFDIAEGTADIVATDSILSAGTDVVWNATTPNYSISDTLRLRLSDATVSLSVGGSVELAGIGALGVYSEGGFTEDQENLDAHGFYTPIAGVSMIADGSVTIDNVSPSFSLGGINQPYDTSIITRADQSVNQVVSAVYPGSLEAASLTGNLDIVGQFNPAATAGTASEIILYPSSVGQLGLYAAADIMPVTIDMEDGDPGLLPGIFSQFSHYEASNVLTGRTFGFPGVLPNTIQTVLQTYHNQRPTHLNDPYPVRIDAGGDIVGMIVSVPKQARIWAGRDIINMMFFGQNLLPTDITRIVAGRDITATTTLVAPVLQADGTLGTPEPALEGNTFIIGGPGSFFLEAGRDAGPFLNSADTSGFDKSATGVQATGSLSFAGGIVSMGNAWNPWLAPVGANLYVEFGVGKGENFDALRDYYLDPANQATWPAYLFQQETTASGNQEPDRNAPIYAPTLIHWMQKNAPALLEAAYGTLRVTFQQAYDAFKTLPELEQQVFLVGSVYFNELTQTSIPTGPSFENYGRGYIAINLLFPASLGYTQNNLGGGTNGANQLVETGNLDLRLSAIESMWGGNVYILGPGGRALIGSTVATAAQAALRTYAGGQLFDGVPILPGGDPVSRTTLLVPYPSLIDSIPAGYEGVITLRGGSIDTFTDQNFLLNQSRLFTEDGGNIAMWSSNGNLDAGEGPKTSSDFPPIVVQVDEDLLAQVNSAGGVTGAGIAAFEPAPGVPAPDVFLIAPRGTVDAGAAGVRVAGNLFVAAFSVANASNFSVGGTTVGVPGSAAVNVAAQTGASSSAAAAAQAAQAASGSNTNGTEESIITVEVIGPADTSGDEEFRKRKQKL